MADAPPGGSPAWAEYKPNSLWIFDTTHFTRAGMAVLIIEDLVSRQWLSTVVSAEETSTQVEVGFTRALDTENLLERVEGRHGDGRVDLSADDERWPILFAISDNGPQMTSGSTRECMALCAIAQHFGRPGTDTPQVCRAIRPSPCGPVLGRCHRGAPAIAGLDRCLQGGHACIVRPISTGAVFLLLRSCGRCGHRWCPVRGRPLAR